jgi:DnaJ homolog subfamily B member 4
VSSHIVPVPPSLSPLPPPPSPPAARFSSSGSAPFHDPRDVFAQFFGTGNPFAAFGGMDGGEDDFGGAGPAGGGMPPGFRVFMGGMPGGGMGAGAASGGMGGFGGAGGAGGAAPRRGPSKGDAVQRPLLLSLEEMYNGGVKKLKVTRQRLNPDGKTTHADEKILEINVKPGWKKGTVITFEGEGDEAPSVQAGDLQFIIGEKEAHDRFVRDGNSLVHTAKVHLADALCGSTLSLRTLDGRTLSIPVPEVVSPGYYKVIKGEGMPISKEPGKKGDLVIKFNVIFPSYIPDTKKAQLRALLS